MAGRDCVGHSRDGIDIAGGSMDGRDCVGHSMDGGDCAGGCIRDKTFNDI